MCKPVNNEFLAALPKCEHHVHIEGTLMPETLFLLSRRNGVPLPSPADDPAYASPEALLARYKAFSCLDDFLAYYYRGMAVLLSAADFEDMTWAYLVKAQADGVRHAEIFFDPQAHLVRGLKLQEVVAGVKRACQRAEKELGLTTLLIACFLRHLPAPDCLALMQSPEMLEVVQQRDIAGVGLDSSESGFPPELFVETYREAKALGLRLTAHAGEEGPAEHIKKSLDVLGTTRIDHGIRLADDEQLLRRVVQQGTMLSVCPLSNVYLRCVDSVGQLPLRKFLDLGVRFSINSDDPAYLGGFILDNYRAVQDAFTLSMVEWETICRNAVEGSWCMQSRKDELILELERVMKRFSGP